MLETECQYPGKTQHPQFATVKDQEMVQRDILYQSYNPFLKCNITQTMLFSIIAALAKLFLFSYVNMSSVQIYF